MASALAVVCVDPRLNHELVRVQLRQRLQRSRIEAQRIWIVNEVGGNLGLNFRHTVEMLARAADPVVFCAVLHHDDCQAARLGLRTALATSAQEMATELARLQQRCPVLTGEIRTEDNLLRWSDEPVSRYLPFTFGAIGA